MNTTTATSLLIILFSILIVIISIILSYKKVKPTLKNLNNLNNDLNQVINRYKKEGDRLVHKTNDLIDGTTALQENIDVKSTQIEFFSDRQHEFQESLLYLKNHSTEYSKGISKNLVDEVKEDGPTIVETFKRTFKKTFNKQKFRYKK